MADSLILVLSRDGDFSYPDRDLSIRAEYHLTFSSLISAPKRFFRFSVVPLLSSLS